ncbi:MAG: NAD(P)H-hydrate dehydratase [Eubacteriales bacterium]|nr:NAD(P)H-hydrate dehydratase [Eubacteriales bacterium]
MKRYPGPDEWKTMLPERNDDSNKGTYGKVLVIAGSRNMCGASYFSAKAAYRTGAGLVYIFTEECNRVILQQQLPEAVLITYNPECITEETIRCVLEGKDAVVMGPGLGAGADKLLILRQVLKACGIKRVLDADALNLLAAHPELWKVAEGEFIITPHPGEMSRLTKLPVGAIKKDIAGTAGRFSSEHQVITVLKDHRTVVSDGTDFYRNTTGNHGMATGGSGDVLAGVIGGLLAQKMNLFEAACLGCYIHGMAGDRARDIRGAYSMMAEDIVDSILYGIS